jgi:hypothetical protein
MPTGIYTRKRSKISKEERKARNAYRTKKLYASSHEYREQQKSHKLMKAYGITIEQYNEFSTFCGDVCCICENKCPSKRRLAVDHDHSNGIVRGLLCINCNKGLGNFKDNVELLNTAINYLTNYQEALREHNAANTEPLQKSI